MTSFCTTTPSSFELRAALEGPRSSSIKLKISQKNGSIWSNLSSIAKISRSTVRFKPASNLLQNSSRLKQRLPKVYYRWFIGDNILALSYLHQILAMQSEWKEIPIKQEFSVQLPNGRAWCKFLQPSSLAIFYKGEDKGSQIMHQNISSLTSNYRSSTNSKFVLVLTSGQSPDLHFSKIRLINNCKSS